VAGGNLVSANFISGILTTSAQPNITSIGTLTSLAVTGNTISGNVYANSGTIGAGLLTGIITTTAQPNITTVGILDNLTVAGNIGVSETVSAGNLHTDGTLTADNIAVSNNANITGNLRATGNINFATSPNVNFGTLANIHISGGSYGYVLTTDGVGNLTWELGESGNGPGGFNTQVQFNANGAFAGSPNLTFDTSTQTFDVGGNLIANTMQIGSGIYQFSKSQVYFAITAGTTPGQVLYSTPAANLMGTEYHIIGTNATDGIRQSLKISSVIYDTELLFNEYAGLQVNGAVGSFYVEYDPGDIMNPPSVKLKVTPTSAAQTVYRILITVYSG
jgi:cytoskeletal protein CcmA (bactofilin family)